MGKAEWKIYTSKRLLCKMDDLPVTDDGLLKVDLTELLEIFIYQGFVVVTYAYYIY